MPVATPRAETAEPAENSTAPQMARWLESSALQLSPTDERQTLSMQVDQQGEATGAAAAPTSRSQVSVAKPHTKTARGVPRPTLPPPSGPRQANLLSRLLHTTVARPSVMVAVSARVRVSGAQGVVGAMRGARQGQVIQPQHPGPPPSMQPPAPPLQYLKPRGTIHYFDERFSVHPKQHWNYTRVDKTLSGEAYLVDSHFHLDKICTVRGMETNNFDALYSPDISVAHPSICLPIKAVTCYMLDPKFDSNYSRKKLMSFYSSFKSSTSVRLMFCVHPVHGSEFYTPTKRLKPWIISSFPALWWLVSSGWTVITCSHQRKGLIARNILSRWLKSWYQMPG